MNFNLRSLLRSSFSCCHLHPSRSDLPIALSRVDAVLPKSSSIELSSLHPSIQKRPSSSRLTRVAAVLPSPSSHVPEATSIRFVASDLCSCSATKIHLKNLPHTGAFRYSVLMDISAPVFEIVLSPLPQSRSKIVHSTSSPGPRVALGRARSTRGNAPV